MSGDDIERDAFVAGAVFAAGPARAQQALARLDELELTPAELIAEHTGRAELCGGSVAGVTITVGQYATPEQNYWIAPCPVCAVDPALPADAVRWGGAGLTRDECVERVREHLRVSHPDEPEHDDADGDADPALVARLDHGRPAPDAAT